MSSEPLTINRACRCVNVAMGSYDNQVVMWTPWRRSDGKHYAACIDACIAHEIASLWALGIKTRNSCCGHGQTGGLIAVYDESIPAMLDLGYLVDPNYVDRPEIFMSITTHPAKATP
jgi:hypothetical protein